MTKETTEEFLRKHVLKFEESGEIYFNIDAVGINSINWLDIFDLKTNTDSPVLSPDVQRS